MKLQNDKFIIDISLIDTESCVFKDSIAYFKENEKCELSKTRIITVDDGNTVSKIALVGDLFLYDEDSAVLEDSVLTVLQNDMLVQIDLYSCRMIKYSFIEEFGGNFRLFLITTGYFVFGESAIAVYDKDLKQVWSFSGKDIFAARRDGTDLIIGKNYIKLYDFEGNFYELDFNGKLIGKIMNGATENRKPKNEESLITQKTINPF